MKEFLVSQGLWLIIDILIYILVMSIAFIFFKKKNSLRVFLMLFAYSILTIVFRVIAYISNSSVLLLSNEILGGINVFIIFLIVTVYSADLKLMFAKIARPLRGDSFLKSHSNSDEELIGATNEIVKATQNMSKNDVGAIIIIVPNSIPSHILETGTAINAVLSSYLLENIFTPQTPLHDGAVIISGNCIVSAGCFLPLSQNSEISKELGTRHRAALGISEETDVLAIIVSEETGIISICERGEMKRYVTPEKLAQAIKKAYGISERNK